MKFIVGVLCDLIDANIYPIKFALRLVLILMGVFAIQSGA